MSRRGQNVLRIISIINKLNDWKARGAEDNKEEVDDKEGLHLHRGYRNEWKLESIDPRYPWVLPQTLCNIH